MAGTDRRRREGLSWRERARYRFDRTLARSTPALLGWLAVCCVALVVPVSALLVWSDPASPRSLRERVAAVWRTSAETMRLGGVTGSPLRMALAALLGAIALLCVSTVIGVITTGLGERLAELRRGRSTVLERGHAVVLGWSAQVFTVVGELYAARPERGREVVAVLADRDCAGMHAELAASLGRKDTSWLVCRSGAPSDPEALARVSPVAARSVLILPSDDADADARVVRALLALRALRGDGPGGPRVVATVRDERHLRAARLAAGRGGTVLEADRTTAQLLVQAARQPGLPDVLRDLLDFSGAEFHLLDAGPGAVGRTYGELALSFEDVCVAGVLRADGAVVLTPPPDAVLDPGDRLVTVAHDGRPPQVTDCRAYAAPPVGAAAGGRPEPVRVLLLGWNRRAPFVVDALRRVCAPGSVLDVVTDPGTATGPGPAGVAPPGQVSGDVPPACEGSRALRIRHRTADPTRADELRALDPAGYDCVIVLRDESPLAPEQADDTTLLTLVLLRSLEEESGRPVHVVAELHDRRSRPLAPLGPRSAVVVRGELTALLMTQIAHEPALAGVFEEIFTVRGGALALRPAAAYVRTGAETAFASVTAAALVRGEAALGYRVREPDGALSSGRVRLCPPQSERRVWSEGDEIVVLTRGAGSAAGDAVLPPPRSGGAGGSGRGRVRGVPGAGAGSAGSEAG